MRGILLIAILVFGLGMAKNPIAEQARAEEAVPVFACDWPTIQVDAAKTEDPDHITVRLYGTLETPTPGYSYDAQQAGSEVMLTLTRPTGMVIQVLDKIEIDESFTLLATTKALTVKLNKTYNWGPDGITCKRALGIINP